MRHRNQTTLIKMECQTSQKERAIKVLLEKKYKIIIRKEELIREIWKIETTENEINEKLKKYGN